MYTISIRKLWKNIWKVIHMRKLLPIILIAPIVATACGTKATDPEPTVTKITSPMVTVEAVETDTYIEPETVQIVPSITATSVETVETVEVPKSVETTTEIPLKSVNTELYVGFNRDAELIAKTLYGECRGIESDMEKAAVAWTILNRVDNPLFPNTVEGVVSQPNQFAGFSYDFPVWDNLLELSKDVLERWYTGDDGRVLPKEYVFFHGDGKHNHFRVGYRDKTYWDWSLPDPYQGGISYGTD